MPGMAATTIHPRRPVTTNSVAQERCRGCRAADASGNATSSPLIGDGAPPILLRRNRRCVPPSSPPESDAQTSSRSRHRNGCPSRGRLCPTVGHGRRHELGRRGAADVRWRTDPVGGEQLPTAHRSRGASAGWRRSHDGQPFTRRAHQRQAPGREREQVRGESGRDESVDRVDALREKLITGDVRSQLGENGGSVPVATSP